MRKIKFTIPFISVLCIGVLHGDTLNDFAKKSQNYTDNTRAVGGVSQHTMEIREDGWIDDEKGKIDDSLLDTVIYNDLYFKVSHFGLLYHHDGDINHKRGRRLGGEVKTLARPATVLSQELAKQENTLREYRRIEAEREANKTKETPFYFVGGYCTVNTPVKIIRHSEFTTLNCLLDFGNGQYRDAEVFAGVYPNYKKETLTVLPMYATFRNEKKVSMEGVVMSEDKGSLNIADHIETFLIRKLVAEYGLIVNNVAYKYANLYLANKIQSSVETRVDYIDQTDANGVVRSIPIVTETQKALSKRDFFTAAGLELFGKVLASIGENILEDSSPLFRIFKGKRVFVEGVISTGGEGVMAGYGKMRKELKGGIKDDNNVYDKRIQNVIRRNTGGVGQTGSGMRVSPDQLLMQQRSPRGNSIPGRGTQVYRKKK